MTMLCYFLNNPDLQKMNCQELTFHFRHTGKFENLNEKSKMFENIVGGVVRPMGTPRHTRHVILN